jgi:catechol 2,3-dioxygenase
MPLTWSHAVLYVRDEARMLDFYTRVLGFAVTDRGPLRGGPMEIIFLSQSPREHHQIALVTRPAGTPGEGERADVLAHVAFRTGGLRELREVIETLERESVVVRPISHGNTWSVYLQDPEGNGLEIFCETPWHVQQPAGETWDPDLDDETLRAWTRHTFERREGFEPIEDYYARRAEGRAR